MLARFKHFKISPETAATVIVKMMENGGKAGCIGGAMRGSYISGTDKETPGFKYFSRWCFNECDKCLAAGNIAFGAVYFGSACFLWPITIPYIGLRSFLSWRNGRVVDA
jgi:hypothetical protein